MTHCLECTKRALEDLENRQKFNPIIDVDTGLQVMDVEAYEWRLRKRLENAKKN